MRILVMGAGVVGVTTAYQLLNDGHEVVVVERAAAAGLETSWGNAGMIAPGHAFAWSSPAAPMILLKSLLSRNQALRFRPSMDPHQWLWLLLFLQQCTHERARRNTLRKHRLCLYSQQVLHETLTDCAFDYDRNDRGIVFFYRSAESLERGVGHMQILAHDGQAIEVLDRDDIVELEPSLAAAKDRIAGGIYCPSDETGDCNKFTQGLAALAADRGAEFHYETEIRAIEADGDQVRAVATSNGDLSADAYVLALGNQSPILARRIGVGLPIYPVKGYSITVPVGNHPHPPTVGAVDEDNLIAISRFGDRLRLTATAEISGYGTGHKPSDFAYMVSVAQELYPDGGDYDSATPWAGLRPMTPEGTPLFGRRKYRNLYFNCGQGHMGWTMAHGSARITADLIAGKPTAVPLDGMTVT
ncbi:MAG: D-amino acid dehydrogenase [Kiloniellales bacterium]|nr:D-amino acid dehydrogenase [Kiloniellales bacterium]